jgi:hypothetical protein
MIDEEYQQEPSDQQEPDYGSDMASMVRQQSMAPTGFDQMTEAQQNVSMGFSPWAHVGKNSQTQQLRQARSRVSMMPQQEQKAPDPRMKDAQFYAGLGDYGAAEALMKSKGGAIFQMDEALELDDVDEQGKVIKRKFTFGPKGIYNYKGMSVPAHMMARKAGVGSIPFKGGDEAARNYRGTLSKLSKMNRELAQLESLYRKNTYLSSLDPSEDAAMARMLESSIKTDYLALMKDMKGMGGSVSDNDMAIASHMVPQRASSAITRLGGNELAILRNVRESAMRKAMEVGEANGLMLIDSTPKARANSYFQKGVIDTQPQ